MTPTVMIAILCVSAVMLAGCASTPETGQTPGHVPIDVTWPDAEAMIDTMHESPKPLDRPVVVVGGWADPGVIAAGITRQLRRALGDDAPIATVTFFGDFTFDACRAKLRDEVHSAFGEDADGRVVEVDVVGFSMGGIVARYAAMPTTSNDGDAATDDGDATNGEPCLHIRRLFTIGTPHRGARLAALAAIDPRAADMRAGSPFLAELDQALADAPYDLVAYVRSGDFIVGDTNASPPNGCALIVDNPPFRFAHLGAGHDPRIIADIARRLRGEAPLAHLPSTSNPEAR